MSRLDQHIGLVRSKLTTEKFLSLVGYSVAIFFACVLVAVLVDRFFWVDLPRQMIWFWGSCGLAVVAALVIAMLRRPTPHQAATMIDEKLGLKEKFGTALFARTQGSSDAFVLASIKDAERTADNISLHRRFPLAFPKSSFAAIGAGVVVLLTWTFLGRVDLFDHHKKAEEAHRREIAMAEAKQSAQTAMAVVNSLPKSIQAQQKVELAKQELQHKIDEPPTDPAVIKLTAKTAQEEAAQAAMQEMKNSQSFAQALVDQAMFKSVTPGADDHGPVADASKDIASGNFAKAVEKLQSMGTKFDQMTPEQQDQALQQMKNLAQQMGQIAKDPAAMNKLQQQLKQQGITQQQIQKATQLAQQAASGNQQAAQQLQQMQQQVMQQMNGGKGPTQQQQQQIAQAMQQMQSVANTQATAQQMTGAAQQMVQGMQVAQSTKAGAAGKGQPGGKGQQASAGNQPGAQQSNGNQTGGQQQGGQQQANSKQGGGQQQGGNQGNQQSGGQQPGGQVAGGNQPGGKQGAGQQPNGGQSGGQNGQNGNGQQQMQQAGQQMADALNQMDAVQKDAEQVAAANNGAGDNGDQGNGTGQKPPGGQGQGGQPNGNHQQGNGQGGAGGVGGWMDKQLAQYTVKQEMDPSQNIANGKILAKSYVKTAQDTGKSTIQLSPAEKATVKESTDEVSEESVPKDAQKAVKEYFDTVGGAADGK